MPDTPTIPPKTYEAQWAQWPMTALERIRLPYPWIVVLMALLGAASVALDTGVTLSSARRLAGARCGCRGEFGRGFRVYPGLPCDSSNGHPVGRWRNSDPLCRSAMRSTRATFAASCTRGGSVESMLICLALLLVIFFLVLPPDQLRGLPHATPIEFAAVTIITLYWTVLFYLLLSLVYISIRNARALGGLAKRPLEINVFDPVGLLPLGRLSLIQSLGFVGVFLIPLVIIGPPSRQGGGWFVIGLSVLGVLAVFVPLWGVHQQILKARGRVLASIYADLLAVQQILLQSGSPGNRTTADAIPAKRSPFSVPQASPERAKLAVPVFGRGVAGDHRRQQSSGLFLPEPPAADLRLPCGRDQVTLRRREPAAAFCRSRRSGCGPGASTRN